ncbi:MAG: exo-alpha-sialidase [Anaerolineae bacterium]|nr:exo-alpha-sialidase [Anaerolineae bacterium]
MTIVRKWTSLALLLVFLLGGEWFISSPISAQAEENGWTKPIIIFDVDNQGTIFTPTLSTDQTGTVHLVWRVVLEDGEQLIYYMRKDKNGWSEPLDIVADQSAIYPNLAADSTGYLNLLWQGPNNQLLYSQARADDPITAHSWSKPMVVDITNTFSEIVADPTGRLHVVYPGEGILGPTYQLLNTTVGTQGFPINIATTSRVDASANYVRLAIGDNGSLHAVWTEFQLPDAWPPTGIFYSHSFDKGKTWSEPLELAGEGYNQANIALINNEVHAVWNGMVGVGGRYHRWSADEGDTWSDTVHLDTFGRDGSTGLPPIAADSAGNLHLLVTDADIDGAGCAMYLSWQDQHWTPPVCISGSDAKRSNYIEEPALTVSNGNQLHAVFWDDRQRLWYTSKRLDVPGVPPLPFPTQSIEIQVTPSPQITEPSPLPKNTLMPIQPRTTVVTGDESEQFRSYNPAEAIVLGLIPVVILTGGLVAFQIFRHRN